MEGRRSFADGHSFKDGCCYADGRSFVSALTSYFRCALYSTSDCSRSYFEEVARREANFKMQLVDHPLNTVFA